MQLRTIASGTFRRAATSRRTRTSATRLVSRAGEFVRWLGDDDWLEPTYTEKTVAAIRAQPDAVLCTTLQRYSAGDSPFAVNDRLNTLPGIHAIDPIERLVQFLHVYENAHWFGIDPVYSLVRRELAASTGLIGPYRFGDFIYACEVAIRGPFIHVPEVLAHRTGAPTHGSC